MKQIVKKKNLNGFRLRVFSPHGTHDNLRQLGMRLPVLTCIRLGSRTVGNLNYTVEINSANKIQNSANKLLMKRCFNKAGVKTAPWWLNEGGKFISQNVEGTPESALKDLPYPIVAKGLYGSRGRSNFLLKDQQALEEWMIGKDLKGFIFEKYLGYMNREYRLHVTEEGCFYTCRKLVRTDTPDDEKWHRHENNSIWVLDSNPVFDRPVNWKDIEADCVKALKEVGLDVGSFDVRIQTSKDKNGKVRENPEFSILEINSGSSFGSVTLEKYVEQIPKIVNYKLSNQIV